MTALRPNYRRARALALEIEALQDALSEAIDSGSPVFEVEDMKAELNHLKHEFFLTGVSSEYEL